EDIGPGAVEDRVDLHRRAEDLAEHLVQAGGVHVLAVGDLVPAVGGDDRREHLGVDPGVVVAGETPLGGVVDRSEGGGLCRGRVGHADIMPSCSRERESAPASSARGSWVPVRPRVESMTGASFLRSASKKTLSGNSSGSTASFRPLRGPSRGRPAAPFAQVDAGCGATYRLMNS